MPLELHFKHFGSSFWVCLGFFGPLPGSPAVRVLEMLDFGLILVLLFLFQANEAVAGVIDLGTVEIFPVFGAMQKGLIDQETGLVLLEAQVITSDLVLPETGEKLSLEEGLARDFINLRTFHVLQELNDALHRVHEVRREGRQLLPDRKSVV